IYINFLHRSLRSTCNILIACCAIFDVLHSAGSLLEFRMLVGIGKLDSYICDSILIHMLIILTFSSYSPYLMITHFTNE
ncbi:hypothetical protein PMAYCL1PPCAC_15007, partial [Pristionchus mayeri]